MKKLILFICSIVLISCATTKEVSNPAPTGADLERGKTTYPDMTMESLTMGKTNFEQQCTKCHSLKNPASKSSEQWHEIVPKMTGKANKKAGTEVINAQMQESILRYLVTMSKG